MVEITSWKYTGTARRDVREILDYTDTEWGTAQMVAYGRMLHDAILRLCRHPDIGHNHPDLPRTIKVVTAGSHLIIYRRSAHQLVVLRVLHHAMDVRHHVR